MSKKQFQDQGDFAENQLAKLLDDFKFVRKLDEKFDPWTIRTHLNASPVRLLSAFGDARRGQRKFGRYMYIPEWYEDELIDQKQLTLVEHRTYRQGELLRPGNGGVPCRCDFLLERIYTDEKGKRWYTVSAIEVKGGDWTPRFEHICRQLDGYDGGIAWAKHYDEDTWSKLPRTAHPILALRFVDKTDKKAMETLHAIIRHTAALVLAFNDDFTKLDEKLTQALRNQRGF